MTRIRTKVLVGLLSLAAISVLLIGMLGLSSVRMTGAAGQSMTLIMESADVIAAARNTLERQLAAINRMPSELDLQKVETLHAKFKDDSLLLAEQLASLSALAGSGADRAKLAAIGAKMEELSKAGEDVYLAAKSFSQVKAVEALEKRAVPAGDGIREALDATQAAIKQSAAGALNDIAQLPSTVTLILTVALFLLSASAAIVTLIIQKTVVRPLHQLTGSLTEVAQGKTDAVIPHTGRKGDIGDIANAVAAFRRQAEERAHLLSQSAEQTRKAEAERQRLIAEMARTIETDAGVVVANVEEQCQAMARALGSLQQAFQRVSGNASAATNAAQSSLGASQAVATASEELTSSIGEIARQVGEQQRIASNAKDMAADAAGTIDHLSQAAGKITSIVDLITDIASKTSLLSLNATIEAARAGEAGRGFAVVAGEVKELATQTARATDDIRSQVEGIADATSRSVTAIAEVRTVIERIVEIAEIISGSIKQQETATQEISVRIVQTSQDTQQVSERISGVSDEANNSRALSESASSMASELNSAVQGLRKRIISVVHTVAGQSGPSSGVGMSARGA
jgi:methyl-accepting chemotaxis protein